jgi:hypothetical protein
MGETTISGRLPVVVNAQLLYGMGMDIQKR